MPDTPHVTPAATAPQGEPEQVVGPATTQGKGDAGSAGEAGSRRGRDAAFWAKSVSTLSSRNVPSGAINRNVEGRKVMSPIQGFGKMWQKTYRINLVGAGATPQEVISAWKQNFPSFWPAKNFFYGPLTGITPGDVAVLNLTMPGRLKLSTGVFVLYADDESFTLMTPQGHMFAGWITFSSEDGPEGPVVQAQVLMRASDPLYEMGLTLGGHAKEDKFWEHTLKAVAAHFDVTDQDVQMQAVVVDKKRQWGCAKNIWHNAAIRSSLYALGTPFRLLAKPFRRQRPTGAADSGRADLGDG